jgi:hypothetical protein
LCMMSLPIFLIHEEGTTNKFWGVNDRHRRSHDETWWWAWQCCQAPMDQVECS